MGFTIVKRSVSIAGHRTSISLEEPFWQGLREIADPELRACLESLGATLAACGPGRRPVPLLGVACPIAITRSATLGRHLAHATGAALENMEAFAVARAAGLFCSRIDGSELEYNQDDVSLPDLIVCRPELSESILDFVRRHGTD